MSCCWPRGRRRAVRGLCVLRAVLAALSASSAVPVVTDSSAGVLPGFPTSSLAVQCPGRPPAPSWEPWVEDSPSLLPVRVLGCVGVRSECPGPALTPPWPGGAPGSAPAATALLFPAQQTQWGFWVWDLFFFPTVSLGLLGLGGPRLHQG